MLAFLLPSVAMIIKITLSMLMAFTFTMLLLKFIIKKRKSQTINNDGHRGTTTITIGFFHPYCNAGGGGERVLWCAIRSLQNRYDFVRCIVYTGDVGEEDMIQRARKRFNIYLKQKVHFVYLYKRPWVTAERYPILTLLGQSMGSIILGFEALFKFTPDIYLDTMGYAFTLPLFKYIGGCKVGCYVHYPTISTDMLEKVNQREADYNNAKFISRSIFLSTMKLMYYKLFALTYGLCGRCSDMVMVNSSWTYGHIRSLWQIPEKTTIVYPPCDTESLQNLSVLDDESTKAFPKQIISVAQFRPEKNHLLQLQIFHKFHKMLKSKDKNKFRLFMIGSCRGAEDEKRVEILKKKAKELCIDKYVQFHVNVSYDKLLDILADSIVGIHTMRDEHFGIGVVEFMASGLITLAHNSAGPKMDIVTEWNDQRTGFLAGSAEQYVAALHEIFKMTPGERYKICLNARESVIKRFSEDSFRKRFLAATETLLM